LDKVKKININNLVAATLALASLGRRSWDKKNLRWFHWTTFNDGVN
jgi:hypothetical protein